MDEKRKPLDLDELFGQARAVVVKWRGKDYELLRLEGINPKQSVQFQRLYARAAELQKELKDDSSEELSDKAADETEKIYDEMLHILNRDLPVSDMPFMAKTRALMYYMQETQGGKALEIALSQTGATSPAA